MGSEMCIRDSDVVGVHLVGGVAGALLIGLLGTATVNAASVNGLFYGGGLTLLGKQALAVVCTVSYSFVATYILAFIVDKVFGGLRVSDDIEAEGLDVNLHAESAYDFTPAGGGSVRTGGGHSAPVRSEEEVTA